MQTTQTMIFFFSFLFPPMAASCQRPYLSEWRKSAGRADAGEGPVIPRHLRRTGTAIGRAGSSAACARLPRMRGEYAKCRMAPPVRNRTSVPGRIYKHRSGASSSDSRNLQFAASHCLPTPDDVIDERMRLLQEANRGRAGAAGPGKGAREPLHRASGWRAPVSSSACSVSGYSGRVDSQRRLIQHIGQTEKICPKHVGSLEISFSIAVDRLHTKNERRMLIDTFR
jgi:hypothetical protein